MKWIRAGAAYVFSAGFFYLILAYIADFSVAQSIVLALLLASLARGIEHAAPKPALKFSPYYVRVDPNWYQLLLDFKLISQPEEWHAIQSAVAELPISEYSVLRNGLCFTIIRQTEDFERILIYRDNRQVFVSEVDFQEDMNSVKIKREHSIPGLREYNVRFMMKFGGDGYNLGIIVPDWWWDEVKAMCPTPLKQDQDYPTGQVELILARISYREFDLYWEPVEWSSTFYEKTSKQIRERRDEHRKKLGWKTVDHDSDLGAELGIDWPESIEHKYFNVEHRAI